MELYEGENRFENHLIQKANQLNLPYGGGIELLPICNMRCNMCYIYNNEKEIYNQILRAEEWIKIGEKAREAGVLCVLLTGGEPLLHPDFKEIYLAYRKMGFIITVNTNGTLINEKWANFFEENPCRRLNITLYGASNNTYEKLCHNPIGFSQITKALTLLNEKNIKYRLNFTMTKENRNDLNKLVKLAEEFNASFIPATYIFPPARRDSGKEKFHESRMSPYEAAETRINATFLRNPHVDKQDQARKLLESITGPIAIASYNTGFSCTAGRSGYWINWQGILSPCTMIPAPNADLKQISFEKGWKEIVEKVSKIQTCNECKICRKKFFCQSCAAACLLENEDFSKKPSYLCEVTDAMIQILLSCLPIEEQTKYANILN